MLNDRTKTKHSNGTSWAMWALALLAQCAINAWVVFGAAYSWWSRDAAYLAIAAALFAAVIFAMAVYALYRTTRKARSNYIDHVVDLVRLDGLTGLLNRTFFLDQIRAGDADGIILVADADHFKRINDTLGHYSGDAALMQLSAAIASAVSDRGVVGRLGGEEFGIFLPQMDVQEGRSIAEKVRAAVAGLKFSIDGAHWPLTVSIGLATHSRLEPISKALKSADDNLYAAKAAGRNCVATQPNAVAEMRYRLENSISKIMG